MVAGGAVYKTKSNNMEAHFYNVDVNWNEERKGVMCSPELIRDAGSCIEVATPPEFPKGISEYGRPSICLQLL